MAWRAFVKGLKRIMQFEEATNYNVWNGLSFGHYLDLSGPIVRTGSMQSVVLQALKKNIITNMTTKINGKLLMKGMLSRTMPATHNVPPVNTIF